MKHTFAEKSTNFAFLGMVALLSVAVIFINSCNKKEISPEKKPQKKNPTAKVVTNHRRIIYLTFDDGPNKGTQNLLKVLHERKVKATAFVVGQHVYGTKKQEEDFENLKNDSLIELSNHSYTHANNKYSTFYSHPEMVIHDFARCEDSLKLSTKIIRTPGRNIWRFYDKKVTDLKSTTKSADALSDAGYKVIGWDLEWKPTKEMALKDNHEKMLKRVDSIFFNDLEQTSRHLVLLTHDQYLRDENSVKELNLFIKKLQETNRFEFRKISDYPNINAMLR